MKKLFFKKAVILLPTVLLLLFILLFVSYAQAADKNWSIDPGSTVSGSGSGGSDFGSWSITGVPNNVRDDNIGTSYGGSCVTNGSSTKNCNFSYSSTVTFPQATNINRAEIVHSSNADGAAKISWTVSLNINGAWQDIMSGGNLGNNVTSSQTGSWSNVSAIQVTASGLSRASRPDLGSGSNHYTYELRAWSPVSLPTVDLKANDSRGSINITYNTAATLSWTSTDAASCTASGSWSGTKATSGSGSTGNLTSAKTYILTCSGPGGDSNPDSVTVNVSSPPPPPPPTHNVSGWAWSDMPDASDEIKNPTGGTVGRGAGWISLNNTNCDLNNDGFADSGSPSGCPAAGTPIANYGVDLDSVGNFSGYAWSEYMGWISFNAADVSGCPANAPAQPCAPKLDKTTGKVYGWARALAYQDSQAGGWDGWIHLRGFAQNNSEYGISVAGVLGSNCSWDGWAWGGDVLGWIHFKSSNFGATGGGSACATTFAINSCSASPATVKAGETTIWSASLTNGDGTETYSWSGNAPLNGLTGNPVPVAYTTIGTKTGSVTVSKIGQDSQSKSCSVSVTVNPGITSFTATPSTISAGDSSTLSWTTTGFADNQCKIDQGVGNIDANGSKPVSPSNSTTYTLDCDDHRGNTDSRQTTVTVTNKTPTFIEIKP